MVQTMPKYQFELPDISLVVGAEAADIQGMHTLLQQEGCPNGEKNLQMSQRRYT